MKRTVLFLMLLMTVTALLAKGQGGVTVVVSPTPVAGGAAYSVTTCGLSAANKTILVHISDSFSFQSFERTVAVGNNGCAVDMEVASYLDSNNVVQPLPPGTTIFIESIFKGFGKGLNGVGVELPVI